MKEALIFCSANVKKFHEAQMPKRMGDRNASKVLAEKNLPIESVALYVPRGRVLFLCCNDDFYP